MKQFTAVIEREDDSYVALCPELDIASQGGSVEEARQNLKEAMMIEMPKNRLKPTTRKPRCGLCGKTKNLTPTACCGMWICNDEHKYIMFSYALNSCHRNHDRYTLCAYHFHNEHSGDWKKCKKCRNSFQTEMYVWYGTNEFNFEKLDNPPSYEATHCSMCGDIIKLGTDGYTLSGGKYWCESCSAIRRKKQFARRKK